MSSPIPVTAATAPFVPTTTPNIERANRLISLRSNPGFLDLLRLSQELVDEAVETCSDYPGWDPQQMVVLKVRQQCAKEHHRMILVKINDAIQSGVDEMKSHLAANTLPEKTAEEAVDQGDYVRQETLKKFDEFDSRPAGSF
jgi:hypothetical protein